MSFGEGANGSAALGCLPTRPGFVSHPAFVARRFKHLVQTSAGPRFRDKEPGTGIARRWAGILGRLADWPEICRGSCGGVAASAQLTRRRS